MENISHERWAKMITDVFERCGCHDEFIDASIDGDRHMLICNFCEKIVAPFNELGIYRHELVRR